MLQVKKKHRLLGRIMLELVLKFLILNQLSLQSALHIYIWNSLCIPKLGFTGPVTLFSLVSAYTEPREREWVKVESLEGLGRRGTAFFLSIINVVSVLWEMISLISLFVPTTLELCQRRIAIDVAHFAWLCIPIFAIKRVLDDTKSINPDILKFWLPADHYCISQSCRQLLNWKTEAAQSSATPLSRWQVGSCPSSSSGLHINPGFPGQVLQGKARFQRSLHQLGIWVAASESAIHI